MKIAIVGGRDFSDYELFIILIVLIISGTVLSLSISLFPDFFASIDSNTNLVCSILVGAFSRAMNFSL